MGRRRQEEIREGRRESAKEAKEGERNSQENEGSSKCCFYQNILSVVSSYEYILLCVLY